MHRRLTALASAALILGCDSITEPEEQRLVDIVLDFCASDIPQWFAYRNQDANWVRLIPNAEGTVSFTATNRVAFAWARQNGADSRLEIVYAHNFELEQVSGRACLEEAGTRELSGSVSGHSGTDQPAQITAGFTSLYIAQPQTTFNLTGLPTRPMDYVASRTLLGTGEQAVNTMIIRRNLDLVTNAVMSQFDLNALGGEAFATTAQPVTITGSNAASAGFLFAAFFTNLETQHVMAATDFVPSSPVNVPMVPANRLVAGDYHDYSIVLVEGASTRGAERFFHAPGAITLAIAPGAPTPTISAVGTTPYLRLRADADRRSEYGGAFRIEYYQENLFATRTVVVTETRLHHGTSGDWQVEIPDFSGVAGFQAAWGPQVEGGAIEWTSTVMGGRAELLLGVIPEDGEGLPFATHTQLITSVGEALARAPYGEGEFRPVASRPRAATARLPRRSWRAR